MYYVHLSMDFEDMGIIFPNFNDEIRLLLVDIFNDDNLTVVAAIEENSLYLNTLFSMNDMYERLDILVDKYNKMISGASYVDYAKNELEKIERLRELLIKG